MRSAGLTLPNKHYVPVDMTYLGYENVSPPYVKRHSFRVANWIDALQGGG